MLFPSTFAPPVTDGWQPSTDTLHQQMELNGRCGKLHAVIWDTPHSKGTVMVFHGNGESIASVESQVPQFQALGYSVMAWDYPGYGRSDYCWFSQDDLLADSETAYQWLLAQRPHTPIVLFGRSIGSGLALYLATKHKVQQVLLVTPYDRLSNVAKNHLPVFAPVELLIRYPLHSDEWISKVSAPIHIIHGLADQLIAPELAQSLVQKSQHKADIVWVKGAGHVDIGYFEEYQQWLEQHLSP